MAEKGWVIRMCYDIVSTTYTAIYKRKFWIIVIQNVCSPWENIPYSGIAKSGKTSHRLLPFLFCPWVLGLFIIVGDIGDGGTLQGLWFGVKIYGAFQTTMPAFVRCKMLATEQQTSWCTCAQKTIVRLYDWGNWCLPGLSLVEPNSLAVISCWFVTSWPCKIW